MLLTYHSLLRQEVSEFSLLVDHLTSLLLELPLPRVLLATQRFQGLPKLPASGRPLRGKALLPRLGLLRKQVLHRLLERVPGSDLPCQPSLRAVASLLATLGLAIQLHLHLPGDLHQCGLGRPKPGLSTPHVLGARGLGAREARCEASLEAALAVLEAEDERVQRGLRLAIGLGLPDILLQLQDLLADARQRLLEVREVRRGRRNGCLPLGILGLVHRLQRCLALQQACDLRLQSLATAAELVGALFPVCPLLCADRAGIVRGLLQSAESLQNGGVTGAEGSGRVGRPNRLAQQLLQVLDPLLSGRVQGMPHNPLGLDLLLDGRVVCLLGVLLLGEVVAQLIHLQMRVRQPLRVLIPRILDELLHQCEPLGH
mmetsp:Transcript_122878/g.393627  ORF Transcript_122878/g.393627 Transcript_122878/m.393627 type:complete len:372 (-) Transcript_122878:797-1912(-)